MFFDKISSSQMSKYRRLCRARENISTYFFRLHETLSYRKENRPSVVKF